MKKMTRKQGKHSAITTLDLNLPKLQLQNGFNGFINKEMQKKQIWTVL